jgi:hypothetical protein
MDPDLNEGNDICNAVSCDKKELDANNGQCLLCHQMYHYECVKVKTVCRIGANITFTCTSCSEAVKQLRSITEQMKPLSRLANELKDFHKEHMKLVAELQENLLQKEIENAELRARVTALTTDLHNSKWGSFTQKPTDMVLSDSMLSNFDQSKLVSTKVVPLSGGRVKTLHDELNKPEYYGAKFKNLTLMVGTNDLQDANGDAAKVTDIINQYKELINDSKAIAEKVTVSSVCPRLDHVKDMIEPFNVNLETLCVENEVDFISNTPILTLGDGSVNDGYLVDGKGPHLTKSGVNKLVRNLKLNVRDNQGDVTKSKPGKRPQNQPQKRPLPPANKPNATGSGSNHPQQPSNGAQHRRASATRQQQQQQKSGGDIWYHHGGCVYCNEPGHNSTTCRHEAAVTCHKCGIQGHKEKHHQ